MLVQRQPPVTMTRNIGLRSYRAKNHFVAKLRLTVACGMMFGVCLAMRGTPILPNASTGATATVSVDGSYCNHVSTTSATCTASYYVNVLGGALFLQENGASNSSSMYGKIGASSVAAASVFDSVGGDGRSATAESSASFNDYAYVFGPSQHAGLLIVPFTLNGSVGVSINPSGPGDTYTGGGGYAYVTFTGNQSVEDTNPPGSSPITGNFTRPFALTNYDSTDGWWYDLVPFGATVYVYAQCQAAGYQSAEHAGICGVDAGFSDTLLIQGLIPEDLNGNVLNGVSIITASGTNYNDITEVVQTPELPSLDLLGIGLALASGSLSMRRRHLKGAR